jgi:hypothetical protein
MRTSPNRTLATIFGAVYLVVGILGFAVTEGVGLFATNGGLLLGVFEVNVAHNAAHLIIGVFLFITGISNVSAAKFTNTVIGGAYLALGVVGLFILNSAFNILALNGADNVLHLGSAIVLLAVGLGADNRSKAITV